MAFELKALKSETEMRRNVVEAVQDLEIPKNRIIVVGGAALQIFGIKTSEDIDLVADDELFRSLLDENKYNFRTKLGHIGFMATVISEGRGQRIRDEGYGVSVGGVTYMPAPSDDLYRASFDELYTEAADIDGILVSRPERILDWKRGVGRQKDYKDILLIEEYLSRQGQES